MALARFALVTPLQHLFQAADRDAKATSYPNNGNFAASGGGVGRVLGKVEILPACYRHGKRFWAFVIRTGHRTSLQTLWKSDLARPELACHAFTPMI
jgi:hypothetical protein